VKIEEKTLKPMESKKTIQELISALKVLRIQEADLTAQLEEAVEEREREGVSSSYETVSIVREAKGVFFKGDRIYTSPPIGTTTLSGLRRKERLPL
jgi:hypothetical protein